MDGQVDERMGHVMCMLVYTDAPQVVYPICLMCTYTYVCMFVFVCMYVGRYVCIHLNSQATCRELGSWGALLGRGGLRSLGFGILGS